MTKRKVFLAQQAVWDLGASGKESMPLASAYLKAVVDHDPALRCELDVRVFNFNGADTTLSVIQRMLLDELPDIVAFSILGWNYTIFGQVAETFRQLNPNGLIVFGGTHVTDQAERVCRMYPCVDIVVNGEGEFTFRELLRAYVGGRRRDELHDVAGLSFRAADGSVVNNAPRARIENLDDIPSPFLTGAMPLADASGRFRYDVALMETNRGCPYKCSFCFWGGAVGQKVRAFSIDRLRAELDLFGRLGVSAICLCDANFGMTRQDEAFMDILIETRERYGYPRDVIANWAKNKGKPFYNIVERMTTTGFHSAFTLALQTLTDPVLDDMGRKNMKLNEWGDLVGWLRRQDLDVYAELVWGAPGETYDSFLEGYDRLATRVTRIATYPLLLLPNTEYANQRDRNGFVTWRGARDDFEHIIAHRTMTLEDNRKMSRFLFWSRIVAENMILRTVWTPLLKLVGLTQSRILLSLDRWFAARARDGNPVAARIQACLDTVIAGLDAYQVEDGLACFYTEEGIDELMQGWWDHEMLPVVPADLRPFFVDLFRWEWLTRPLYRREDVDAKAAPDGSDDDLPIVSFHGVDYRVRENVRFDYDVPSLVRQIASDERTDATPSPLSVTFFYKKNFAVVMGTYTDLQLREYVGITLEELAARTAGIERRRHDGAGRRTDDGALTAEVLSFAGRGRPV